LNVLDFLKKPNAIELVSGTNDRVNLHDKLHSAIEAAHPGMINQLELEVQQKAAAQKKKASFWDSALDANTGGFKFSVWVLQQLCLESSLWVDLFSVLEFSSFIVPFLGGVVRFDLLWAWL
jgi:hypothetical protein